VALDRGGDGTPSPWRERCYEGLAKSSFLE
jgi:hypothetical protein